MIAAIEAASAPPAIASTIAALGPEWVISLPPTAVPDAIPTTTAVLSQPNTSAWVPGSAESCTMP